MTDIALDSQTNSPNVLEHRYPCPVCGSEMRYNPETGGLHCYHCGHEEEILAPAANWKLTELDLEQAYQDQISSKQYDVAPFVHCENCGANIEFGQFQQAKECPYCATPIVLEAENNRQLRPQGVIPFIVDERQARTRLEDWLGRRWFAPNGLSKYARSGRRLNGVYIPYWTYDAHTQTQYSGRRGDVYYVTVGHGDNRRQEPRIRWSRASGRVKRFFDDILIMASTAMPKRYMDELEPWDLAALEPYNPQFLAGFDAEAYSLTLEQGWHEAQAVMKSVIIRDIKFDIGGDRQQIDKMHTEMSGMSFKHILLPIYTLAYKFRGKTYRCVINGQTGRVTGERPFSAIKIALAVIAIIIATLIGLYLYNAYGGGVYIGY